MPLYPPSPYSEYNYGGSDVCRVDESLYLDESWKHQPDYSGSDSNDSSVPSHSPNLIEMNAVTGSNFPITGTNFTFGNQQEDSYNWQTKHPQTWDQCDVSRWIQNLVDTQQLPTSVRWEAFGDIDGAKLCAMSMEEIQAREPTYGCDLYMAFHQNIHQPAMHYQQTYVYNQSEMMNYEGTENMTSLERYINIISFDKDDKFTSLPNIASFTTKPDCVPAPARAAVPLVIPKDEPESDSDTLSSPPSSPSPSEDSVVPTRTTNRRGRGKGKLWEFVLNLLLDNKTNPEIIKWEDRQNGVFRIVRSDQVAKLWGIRKSNPSMTYEKMSRAMRYYYRKNILERIDGRRLVYKFGPSSRGWQLD